MKKTIKFLGLLLSASVVALTISCGSDDDKPKIDDDVVVSDGFYMIGTASGADAAAVNQFGPGIRNLDGERTEIANMFEAYVYLDAGTMNFVSYTGNVATSYGGTTSDVTVNEGDDVVYTYQWGDLSVDGAAVNIATAGLYHVIADFDQVNAFFIMPVNRVGVLGAATEASWDYPDIELVSQGVSATGGTWETAGIDILNGFWKFRINNSWDLDLTETGIDGATFNIHKDFGDGGGGFLKQGYPDFNNDSPGTYTVTVTWTPGQGMGIGFNLNNTGVIVITFEPDDYKWGVLGDGTAGGWDADRDLKYIGYDTDATKHTWAGVVYLGSGVFKFRTNDSWDVNIGGTLVPGTESTLDAGGADIAVPADTGAYYLVVSTVDEGDTWQANMSASNWGIIGDATPGGWDASTPLNADGFADGITTYTGAVAITAAGEYKFRANDDWAVNVGGALDALVFDGGNLSVDADGTYDVVLSFDGTNYTATVTAQ